jgi:signal transduction histidine kinase
MDYPAVPGRGSEAQEESVNYDDAMTTSRNITRQFLAIGIMLTACLLTPVVVAAQSLTDRYNKKRPLVVVCDWDKAPYEFLNDQGQPAGSNIDLLRAITNELGIPCEFVMKEWTTAIKTFERGEADIILANVRRYRSSRFYCTENIINYNRICVAVKGGSSTVVTKEKMLEQGVVMKYGDYVSFYFRDSLSHLSPKVEFQSPKVALQGLLDGDFTYFLWGEEPLKRKIKDLDMKGITINDVDIPVSEIHIIGHDKNLIYQIDDCYSRLKQRGEVQQINDRWLHPERVATHKSYWFVYIILGVLLLGALLYALLRLARHHVKMATRNSSELNSMMFKALRMGKIHVLEYDIKRDLMINRYGTPILPERGVTLEEFAQRIHPHEMEEFRQKMQLLIGGRERKFVLNKRWRAYSGDGQWLSLKGHAILELDDSGQPAFIINALSDITHNFEEYRSTRELECKYQALANMPFMAMSFYDKNGWLIDLNDSMRQLCGITPDKPESQRYWMNISMFDIPLFRNAYHSGARHELLACMHMDYPDIDIDSYIEYNVRPLFDEHGDVVNYFCSALDITNIRARSCKMRAISHELKATLDRTDRFEQLLNFITKQGHTYLWNSDIDKRTTYFYRSLRSDTPADYIVLPFETQLTHMPEEERATTESQLCDSRPDASFDSIHHFTSTVLDPRESWFHIIGKPVIVDGRVVGHRGQSIDITEEMNARHRLEAEKLVAKDIVRLKSGFMASMTHELRTPLNAIIGFTDILGVIDNLDERQEYIRIIRNNCDMLQRLIDDILEASALNEGPTRIEITEVDFAKAFDDICLTLQQRVQGDVAFIRENPYNSFITTLDIGRVNQVITNFVTNAVKFTKKGHIRLSYRYHNHQLEISCEDTGIGIPEHKQDIVFNRFVKLDEFVQGTGMGLAICKSIAERMGGHISLKSDGKDRGCTFMISIPCERKLSPSVSTQ